jgi:hypothetical protein
MYFLCSLESFAENPQFMFSITDPDPYDAKQVGRIKKKTIFLPFFPLSQNIHGFRIFPAIVCSAEIKLCIVRNWLDRILTAGNRFLTLSLVL